MASHHTKPIMKNKPLKKMKFYVNGEEQMRIRGKGPGQDSELFISPRLRKIDK